MTSTHQTRPLYIFVHVPKTAGTTFGLHVDENFKRDEVLPVYFGRDYYNVVTGTYEQFQCREDIHAYLRSLSAAQKARLRVVYGHEVFYGMREYFDRTVRFITFLRHPEQRVLSVYNHYRRFQWIAPQMPGWKTNAHFRRYWSDVRQVMQKDGKPIPFADWVHEHSVPNYMYTFLFERGFLDVTPENIIKTDPQTIFNKLFFVGTTEHFNDESLFLFHELGISKFYSDQNVSQKYVRTLDADVVELIRSIHGIEYALYDAARAYAASFKRQYQWYDRIVRIMKLKRCCNFRRHLGTLDPVHMLYKLSAFLKQRSNSYAAAIERVKRTI